MSSPPPPWESHRQLEDEGSYGAATDADPDADTEADVAPVDDVVDDGDWPHGYYPPVDTDFEEIRPVQWQHAHPPPQP